MAPVRFQAHRLLMLGVGFLLVFMSMLTYFSKFDTATWRAFGLTMVVLGGVMTPYVYSMVPAEFASGILVVVSLVPELSCTHAHYACFRHSYRRVWPAASM